MLLGRSCKILPPNLNELDVLEKKKDLQSWQVLQMSWLKMLKNKNCVYWHEQPEKNFSLFNFYHLNFLLFHV